MENLCVVSASLFQTGKPDKNGSAPVILNPISGKIHYKRILPGTIAKNLGIVPGETYLMKWMITGRDNFGDITVYTCIGKVSYKELTELSRELGDAQIIKTDTAVTTNELPAEL